MFFEISGKLLLALGTAHFFGGCFYWMWVERPKIFAKRTEEQSIRHALMPLVLAERDRAFLKQLRINRDAEIELMADVKDWEVGTWYGEPVFKTVKDEE